MINFNIDKYFYSENCMYGIDFIENNTYKRFNLVLSIKIKDKKYKIIILKY